MRNAIVKTDNLSYFEQVADFLSSKSGEQMCLVWGLPGTGKTFAAKYLASVGRGQYVSCIPGLSGLSLMRLILADHDVKVNSFAAGMTKVIDIFKESKQALLVDEIDFIIQRYDLLESLRTIHDQAGIPVIVFGMAGIQNKVKPHKQLCDRIHFVEFTNCTFSDIKQFALEVCEVKIDEEHLKNVFAFTKGNLRNVKRCLEYAEDYCRRMESKILSAKEWGNMPLLPKYATEKKGGK
jgi:DNA transposition AAA+ family ATPase